MALTQKERVLGMLRAAGDDGVTTSNFLEAMIPRFSARIEELREDGHAISSTRLSSGSWRYTLSGEAERDRETLDAAWRENDARLEEADGLFDLSEYDKPSRGPYDYD